MSEYPNTVLLTGIPRSGTTLCCHLLNQYANTVALHEPIAPDLFVSADVNPIKVIHDFVRASRERVFIDRSLQSKHRDGVVPDNPITERADGAREESVVLGSVKIEKPLTADFTLVIKHNALFTSLIHRLIISYDIYALVRNPLTVLASWNSISLPVAQGRLPMGERFNDSLRQALIRENDVLERQLLILQWFFDRYRELEAKWVLTYEELVDTDGNLLSALCGFEREEHSRITAQYDNSRLSRSELIRFSSILIERAEIFSGFYTPDEVRSTLDKML